MKHLALFSISMCFLWDVIQGGFYVPEYEVLSKNLLMNYEERLYPKLNWVTVTYNGSDEEAYRLLNRGTIDKAPRNMPLTRNRKAGQLTALLFRKTCKYYENKEKCLWFSVALPSSADVTLEAHMKGMRENSTVYYVRNLCKEFGINDPFSVFKMEDFLSEGIEYSGDSFDDKSLNSVYRYYVSNMKDDPKSTFKPFCEIWKKKE
ncbi:uncharacterized protein [Centruroides vittatus]|uniref:uncharacterized protein n=1 Tax=Centruroides vittatus TaxID=120091 RepID=UPI00350EB3B0